MDVTGATASSGLHAVSGASYSGPPQQKMSDLFDSIDSTGSGSITQGQFDQAFQTKNPPAVFQNQGSNAVFSALDPNNTGSVPRQDFVSGMSQLMVSLRSTTGSQTGSQDSLAASLSSLGQIDPASAPAMAPPGSLVNLTV